MNGAALAAWLYDWTDGEDDRQREMQESLITLLEEASQWAASMSRESPIGKGTAWDETALVLSTAAQKLTITTERTDR